MQRWTAYSRLCNQQLKLNRPSNALDWVGGLEDHSEITETRFLAGWAPEVAWGQFPEEVECHPKDGINKKI